MPVNKSMVSKALRNAYEEVRRTQRRIALTNQMARDMNRYSIRFEQGDFVLLWEPEKLPGASQQVDPIPKKFTFRYSGPHTILKQVDANTYVILRNNDPKSEQLCNVNRLRIYHPWDDDENDVPPPLKLIETREKKEETESMFEELMFQPSDLAVPVQPNDMVIIRMEDPDYPWEVAKCLKVNDDNNTSDIQWFGNLHRNPLGAQRPGWWISSEKRYYYNEKRKSHHHKMFTNILTETTVYTEYVLCHGFSLTSADKVPVDVLRLLDSNPNVAWKLPSISEQ